MNIKLIGAMVIIVTCGTVGFKMSSAYIKQERQLEQLIQAFHYVKCELRYRLTPLSQQFQQCSALTTGAVSLFFAKLREELDSQINPNAGYCLNAALEQTRELTPLVRQVLSRFGQTLGSFDVDGQLLGLEDAIQFCHDNLDQLKKEHPARIRNYQTLGLCAGVALAILFI